MRQRDAETAKKEPEKVSVELKNNLFKIYKMYIRNSNKEKYIHTEKLQ